MYDSQSYTQMAMADLLGLVADGMENMCLESSARKAYISSKIDSTYESLTLLGLLIFQCHGNTTKPQVLPTRLVFQLDYPTQT